VLGVKAQPRRAPWVDSKHKKAVLGFDQALPRRGQRSAKDIANNDCDKGDGYSGGLHFDMGVRRL